MKKTLEGCNYIALESSSVTAGYLQPVVSSDKYRIYMCIYFPHGPFDLRGTVL